MIRKLALWLLGNLVSEAAIKTLLEDLFALLRAGVGKTSTDLDDKALDKLESSIDKDALAHILALRLNDLLRL